MRNPAVTAYFALWELDERSLIMFRHLGWGWWVSNSGYHSYHGYLIHDKTHDCKSRDLDFFCTDGEEDSIPFEDMP